ncbi:M1 family aminopeptidase [Corallococcus sp. Z5C101001]|uniref:M1 family aminopeptidase n=1 Tax=Corallococcus sp. Z5C101001 TaxID=2596829 RepID=UPI00117FA1D1|nr:M1 family aminopeptidase [Corallococcus sp. Z5C101001]TSC32213.1 M1 family metallopeptidase [Corallococcus sp. Z5C101001]
MRTLPGWWLLCVLVASPVGAAPPAAAPPAIPGAGSVAPEVQLCLQHLKPSERDRAAKALGPLESVPLYRVQLEVSPKERRVWGKVQVELVAKGPRPLTELYLRLTPNTRSRQVTLSGAKVNGKAVALELGPEPTLQRVAVEPPVAPGGTVSLEVAVKGTVPKAAPGAESLLGAGGLLGGAGAKGGADDHGAFSATADVLSLVGVVPQVPPVDDQGQPWAGPQGMGDLALYEPAHVLATLTVPSGWAAHATGTPLGEVPERDGRVRYSFAAAAVRDFPVLVTRGYTAATATVNGVTVESHFAPQDAASGKRVLKYASQALTEFEKRLGPLPYTHFRVVQAPLSGGAGGMEFPGLVTVATSLYRAKQDPLKMLAGMPGMEAFEDLLDAQGAGLLAQMGAQVGESLERTLEFTVAHEVAHQYFAGLVGSDPIREPVVDESLAQYAALLYMEWAHGPEVAESLRNEALVMPYQFFRMTGGRDGRADRPTGDFDGGELEYGALVYGKAPLLHHASRELVGDAAFFKALRAYVDTYRFKWACKACFTQELAKASPVNAKALGRLRVRWWEEAHGDEDLGAADLQGLMEAMGGSGGLGGVKLDAQTQALLEQLLPQLMGP